MKKLVFVVVCLVAVTQLSAQKYYTKSGRITFVSNAPMEDIEAKNKSVVAILDSKTGALQFSVIMKGFEFTKALMQEHFNENYVESHKYPKAEFKGTITNNRDIDYSKPGSYTAKVKGKLTIHGVTKNVETTGNIKVEADGIKASSAFNIAVADYKIRIEPVVREKISKIVKINVDTNLELLKN
jgi:hypothetical protein